MGYTIINFINDTLIFHSSLEGCYESIHSTVKLLKKMRPCINEDKSVLIPTQRLEYLGNVIDSETMTVTLPERRKEKIIQSCNQLFHSD